MSDVEDPTHASVRRRRVLAAHAELFRELLAKDQDRLSKLANVIEALGRSSAADILDPFRVTADYVSGVIRLERTRRRVEIWWECKDLGDLLRSAVDRKTDVLVVIQGFPLEFPRGAGDAGHIVLLDGHDIALLLEGRWMLGQAVRFKQAQQEAHGRFINLRIAPPVELPYDVDLGVNPEGGQVLSSNIDNMPAFDDDESRGRVDAPELWEIDRSRSGDPVTPASATTDASTLRSNIEAHGDSVAKSEAVEEAENRRLRRMWLGVAAFLVLAVLVLIVVVRGSRDADTVSLRQAADMAVRASRLEFNVYHTLDTSELRSVFSEMVAQSIEAQVQELRTRGVYLDGNLEQEVLGSQVEGQAFLIALQESGDVRIRSSADGQTLEQGRVQRVIGFELNKQADDRWRVVRRGQLS